MALDIQTPAPTPATPSYSPAVLAVTTLFIPLVTIVGLIVLMALHDIDQTAAIAIISGLAGVHGGAAVATAASK